jgi:hypothetical protein
MGWGEFEIQLDVYLSLPEYPVVNLVHQLKVLNIRCSYIIRTPAALKSVKNHSVLRLMMSLCFPIQMYINSHLGKTN